MKKVEKYTIKVKDSKKVDDSQAIYSFKTGIRTEAFKQYLRDRGIKFEPSQDGERTVFVVFNADDAVDRRARQIVAELKDSVQDATAEYEVGKYNKEWGVFAKRSRAWVAFGTKEKMTERAKRLNELEKQHASNFEKRNKMKDGAINYKHSKNDMPSYGVDLRYSEEDYNDIYFHDMLEQTESLVEDANEKIQAKGYELVDDYYGDEVNLVVDPGYYEGFTLNIEANEGLPKELLEYAYGLMAEIAKEVGLVKMKFGGWTGPVYLGDSKKVKDEKSLIQAKEGDTIIDTKTNKEGKVVRTGQSGNYDIIHVDFGKGSRRIVPMEDIENRYKFKDSKKRFTDMNAEEIIALFREAGEKQRSWYWLQNKLPEEFLDLTGKGHAQLFPVKQYRKEYGLRGVNLTKPKRYVETLNWDWLPVYEKLKLELDDILRNNNASDFRDLSLKLRNMIKEEDSISRRNMLEGELKGAKELESEIYFLISRNLVLPRGYRREQFTELDFNFDKKDFINAFKGSYEEGEYVSRQKTPIVGGVNSQYIYTNDDKVGMITPEAEDYIRRIMKEATTSGITNKRTERNQNRRNRSWEHDGYEDDIINLWRKDRRQLSLLLREFKQIAYEGSIDGIHKNYRGKRVVRGVKEELQEPLMDALGKAFVAKTVADLRRYLQEAVDAVDLLPTDGQKERDAKNRITNFLEEKKEEIEGRKATRTKRLPDSNAKYLYLFPQLTQDEIGRLGRYNLVFKGFNAFNDELNYVVTGNKEDIEEFADDEMGYELHEDYLYAPGDFAGDVFKIEEAQLEDAINFFEGELGYITGEMRFAIGDDPEGDEHNHILEQIKIRGWDENLQEIILKLYDNDEDMEKACIDVLELLEDIKGE